MVAGDRTGVGIMLHAAGLRKLPYFTFRVTFRSTVLAACLPVRPLNAFHLGLEISCGCFGMRAGPLIVVGVLISATFLFSVPFVAFELSMCAERTDAVVGPGIIMSNFKTESIWSVFALHAPPVLGAHLPVNALRKGLDRMVLPCGALNVALWTCATAVYSNATGLLFMRTTIVAPWSVTPFPGGRLSTSVAADGITGACASITSHPPDLILAKRIGQEVSGSEFVSSACDPTFLSRRSSDPARHAEATDEIG